MNEKKLQQYAELLVKEGIRVNKREIVFISGGVENSKFITKVVEECYKAGAKAVHVDWNCDEISKLHYQKMSLKELSKIPSYMMAKYKYMRKNLPCRLYIDDSDPDAMAGVDQEKIAKARMASYPKIKPIFDAMSGRYKWCIAAIPSVTWARKVFPGVSDEEAMEKL